MEAAAPHTLPGQAPEHAGYTREVEEASLSVTALRELMRAVLDRGVPFRFRAPGFSMFPFVKDGDVITVCRLTGGAPGIGRVVAFVHPGTAKVVVHRVVGRKAGLYLTKGDNSPEPDAFVRREGMLGCVTKIERNGRRVCLGLGVERVAIAVLSRRGLLPPLLLLLAWLARRVVRMAT